MLFKAGSLQISENIPRKLTQSIPGKVVLEFQAAEPSVTATTSTLTLTTTALIYELEM